MPKQDPTLLKGTFQYEFNGKIYQLEGHYGNIIVKENGLIFPDNTDLIKCTVVSTCNTAISDVRPETEVICNKNDMIKIATVGDRNISYLPHFKIISKVNNTLEVKSSKTTPDISAEKAWEILENYEPKAKTSRTKTRGK